MRVGIFFACLLLLAVFASAQDFELLSPNPQIVKRIELPQNSSETLQAIIKLNREIPIADFNFMGEGEAAQFFSVESIEPNSDFNQMIFNLAIDIPQNQAVRKYLGRIFISTSEHTESFEVVISVVQENFFSNVNSFLDNKFSIFGFDTIARIPLLILFGFLFFLNISLTLADLGNVKADNLNILTAIILFILLLGTIFM